MVLVALLLDFGKVSLFCKLCAEEDLVTVDEDTLTQGGDCCVGLLG